MQAFILFISILMQIQPGLMQIQPGLMQIQPGLMQIQPGLMKIQPGPMQPEKTDSNQFLKGSIEHINGHRIVNLWGSHYEMGYAHGFLLGPEIMALVENYGLGVVTSPYLYESYLLPLVRYAFFLKPEYRQELQGIVSGMKARGTDIFIDDLGRDITVDDLWTMNLIPDLSRYGCSVVFAWGDATSQDPVLASGSCMVRDLDWGYDPSGLLYSSAVIFAFQSAKPGEKGFLSFSWPGLISCISGYSEDGIGATINYGNYNGYGNLFPEHFNGVGFAIRDGLEETDHDGDGYSTHLDLYHAVSSCPLLSSFELGLVGPYPVPGHPGLGAGAVLEINNLKGFALREVSNNRDHTPILESDSLLAVTNHHRLLYSPVYCSRYNYQVSQLSIDFMVDTDELWAIEAAISHSNTMHMTVFRPNLLDLFVAFNETQNGAAHSIKNYYRLGDLFPNH